MSASTDEGGTIRCTQEACTRSKFFFLIWVLHFGDHSFTDVNSVWLVKTLWETIGIRRAMFSNRKQQNFPKNQPCGLRASSMLFLRHTQDTVEICKSLCGKAHHYRPATSTSPAISKETSPDISKEIYTLWSILLGPFHLAFSSWRGVRKNLHTEEGRVLPKLLISIS